MAKSKNSKRRNLSPEARKARKLDRKEHGRLLTILLATFVIISAGLVLYLQH